MADPIKPIWKKWDYETGEWIFGISPTDMARVEAGYACGYCLEPFEMWVPVCSFCGRSQEKHRHAIAPTPVEWLPLA